MKLELPAYGRLVEIGRDRKERELRRATANWKIARSYERENLLYVLIGFGTILAGFLLVLDSMVVRGHDTGLVLLIGGLVVGNGGPLATLMILQIERNWYA